MLNTELITKFRHFRRFKQSRGLRPANEALSMARLSVGVITYATPTFRKPVTNPVSKDGFLWVEDINECGLRLVGYADDLNRHIEHTGWFGHVEYQEDLYRGVVLQLAGKDGQVRFVPGYEDAWNSGSYFVGITAKHWCVCIDGDHDAERAECALRADNMAMLTAHDENEYCENWDRAQAARTALAEAQELTVQCVAIFRAVSALLTDSAPYGRIKCTIIDGLFNSASDMVIERDSKRCEAFGLIDEHKPAKSHKLYSAWVEGYGSI